MKRLIQWNACVLILAAVAGCSSSWNSDGKGRIRPTVAVIRFETRVASLDGWELGEGFQDVLVDQLVETNRFVVIERPDINSVLGELELQQSGVTRPENRSKTGRLKNVQYLVKGSIVDFSHVARFRSFFGLYGVAELEWMGTVHWAVMGVVLQVVEVESGEVVYSKMIEKYVPAMGLDMRGEYKDVGFGGGLFYRTPLGKATKQVLHEAVTDISEVIEGRPWQARLADVNPDGKVLINGGKTRNVQLGDEYEAVSLGPIVLDPDTGDAIGRRPGKTLGRVRVCRVHEGYSIAIVIQGKIASLQAGQYLQKLELAPKAK